MYCRTTYCCAFLYLIGSLGMVIACARIAMAVRVYPTAMPTVLSEPTSTTTTILPPAVPALTTAAPTRLATDTFSSNARPLTLSILGDVRKLPVKILGASAGPFYEHLLDHYLIRFERDGFSRERV
jgi:hypothetical protein